MRMTLFCLVATLVLGFCFTAWAEDQEPKKEEEQLGWRENMTLRYLTGALGLDDAQQKKIKTALINATKAAEREIRGALNTDQQKQYDEMKKREREQSRQWSRMGRGGMGPGGMGGFGRGGFGRGPGRRGNRGMFGNFDMGFGRTLEEWKKRLKLDDTQVKKIEEIFQGIMEEASGKFMEKLPEIMQGGRFDREKLRKVLKDLKPEVDKYIDRAEKKIRKVLREDQLPEFEKVMAEFRKQIDDWMSGNRMPGGRDGRRGPRDGSQWRLDRILSDLKLPPEEAEILKPKIEEILKVESEFRRNDYRQARELRTMMSENPDSGTIKEKLDALRVKRKEHEEQLKKLREGLRELLTFEQEAKLVVHSVLD